MSGFEVENQIVEENRPPTIPVCHMINRPKIMLTIPAIP